MRPAPEVRIGSGGYVMATDPTFRMTVTGVFAVSGLGTVALGQIELGTINLYDRVWLRGNDATVKTGIAFIQAGSKSVKTATAGENVGLVLRGLPLDRVHAGNVVSGSES
jgi:translation elongation factor EF-Tu-like GTPase